MMKRLFSEHGVRNAVTLFHKPSNPASTRILTLLKQTSAAASTTATEDQASNHSDHSRTQHDHAPFDLDVVEGPPTADQLRSIISYVGERNAGSVVPGAQDAADAARKMRQDMNAFRRPLVVDWNAGKVVVGEKQSDVIEMLKNLEHTAT